MTGLELYDATLRDGMQGEGMSLSAHEKVRVARKLDELGVQDLGLPGRVSTIARPPEGEDLLPVGVQHRRVHPVQRGARHHPEDQHPPFLSLVFHALYRRAE